MRKFLYGFFLFLVMGYVSGDAFANTPIVISQTAQSRSLSPIYFGYNAGAEAVRGNIWGSTALHSGIKRLQPGTIRFPGGTVANYWDWQNGWVYPDPDGTPFGLGLLPAVPNKLEDFKHTVDATGVTPIFVLNVLTSTLQSQLAMLRHARDIGLDVSYIELGNEFWLNDPDNVAKFPTGASYGTLCSQWIPAIRAEFPNVEIAAVGAGPMGILPEYFTDPRMNGWNQSVLSTLVGADALTIHFYEKSGLPDTTTLTTDNVQTMLGIPFMHWLQLQSIAIDTFPEELDVWITEYNMTDVNAPVHGTWAHALYDTVYALLFLEHEQVTIANLHQLVGHAIWSALFIDNNAFLPIINIKVPSPLPVTVPFARSAAGFALSLLNQAAIGMTSTTKLSFDPNPIRQGGLQNRTQYPSLVGRSFSDGNRSQQFILNLSGESFVYTADISMQQYEQWSANPTVSISNGSQMMHLVGSLATPLVLPPYSATLLLSTPMGDANADANVDGRDFIIWLGNVGRNLNGPHVGDFDSNGIVNNLDFVIWKDNVGKW